MSTVWIELGATFLVWFALASIVGAANYWVFYGKQEFLQFFVVTLPVLSVWGLGMMFFISAYGIVYLLPRAMIILAVLCLSQMLLEMQIARHEGRADRHRPFLRSFLTHICSLSLGGLLLILTQLSNPSSWYGAGTLHYGYYSGLLLTPISISAFRWMLLTAKLRPGIDRQRSSEDDN